MKPFIFSLGSPQRSKLRDYIIDLNREKNLQEIVNDVYKLFEKFADSPKNNFERINGLMLKTHTKEEMCKIIEINLKRLNITFSKTVQDTLSGNDFADFWYDAFYDGEDTTLQEFYEDFFDDENPDNIPNGPEKDQLDEIAKQEKGST